MSFEDMSVTFTDWIIEESKLRNKFFHWWFEKNKEHPDIYPDKLESQEWEEQYNSWLNCRGQE